MTFNELLEEIKTYESNTFFAAGCDLTDKEAVKLAEMCIDHFVNNRLDGVMLDNMLTEIRSK